MLDSSSSPMQLPPRPGVGYKPQHFDDLLSDPGPVAWIEVHAENYMGDGGRPLAQLRHLRERFAVSVHGVGLSIGGDAPLDRDHLAHHLRRCYCNNCPAFTVVFQSHPDIR